MRYRQGIILLLLLAFMLPAQDAAAQFWKRKDRRRDRDRKESVREDKPVKDRKEPEKERETTAKKRKKDDIEYPETIKKDRYRIDVLVPLYLSELVKNGKPTYKGKMPAKAVAGVDFYEGVKMAADTLSNYLYNIDVYIHDVADPAKAPEKLIKNNTFDTTDLIIGAVHSYNIPEMAAYAKEHNINFVSALSPSDGNVKDNPFFILLQPTLRTHCERIMSTIENKYPRQRILMYYSKVSDVDSIAYRYITNVAEDNRYDSVNCAVQPDKMVLAPYFDSTITNVIVMAVFDKVYATTLLKQLYEQFPNYRFDVYGMPSWKTMDALRKPEAFPNVAVYFTVPYHFEANTPAEQAIYNKYKKEFGGKPSELVFRGYETMFWYAYMLNKYGTIFNNKFSDNGAAPFTRFTVKPSRNDDGDLMYQENQHLYLYRYQSSSYMVEQVR